MDIKEIVQKVLYGVRVVLIAPLWLLIKIYQWCISPLLPSACRFTPTCSQYAIDALKKHGLIKGLAKTIWRIMRCNPFGGHGHDPA